MSPTGRPEGEHPGAQREGDPLSRSASPGSAGGAVRSTAASRLAAGADVASPCVSLCEMSPHNGFCIGCFRTLDEIASWSVLDADAKQAIVAALPARAAAATPEPRR